MPLFREEAIEHRTERLYGDVTLALPVSWQLIGFSLFAALAAGLVFLAMGSFSRVETAAGVVALDSGIAAIVPSRPGVVARIHVEEGERVKAGAPLVRIRAEEDMAAGQTAPSRMIDALEEQDRRLSGQSVLTIKAAGQEQARLKEQIAGLERELASLDSQIISQLRLLDLAANEYRDVQDVAHKGFISRRDLEAREATVITRRQQQSQLEQARSAKIAELSQARRAIAETGTAAEAQAAGLQSSRAQLTQRRAELEMARGYTLTSPIDGTVTVVTARLGQAVNQQQAIMVVMPAIGTLRAELQVPNNAAGFLAVGQDVRIAVDAFPYQRFGTLRATILRVSSVALTPSGSSTGAPPSYQVTVKLAQSWVMAFGRRQPLVPGMTLTARIITERQNLFQWLFEPLFAVQRR